MQGEEAFQESVRSMRHQTLRADRAEITGQTTRRID